MSDLSIPIMVVLGLAIIAILVLTRQATRLRPKIASHTPKSASKTANPQQRAPEAPVVQAESAEEDTLRMTNPPSGEQLVAAAEPIMSSMIATDEDSSTSSTEQSAAVGSGDHDAPADASNDDIIEDEPTVVRALEFPSRPGNISTGDAAIRQLPVAEEPEDFYPETRPTATASPR